MVKAVIFDMYETLITLWYAKPYMGKQMSEDIGIPENIFREIWDSTDNDRTLGVRSFEDVVEEILRVNNRYSDELFKEVVRKRKESKKDSFNNIHPGVVSMLEKLKNRGIKIGLITNCFLEERDVIKDSVLFPYFDVTCMSCELGLKKPDRKIFDLCVEKLGVKADECIYCGDGGSNELAVAESMNMKTVQALWYLKEGSGQPVGRMEQYVGAAQPMDIVKMVEFVPQIVSAIKSDINVVDIKQLSEGEVMKDVYVITDNTGEKYILKIAGQFEIDTYENYISAKEYAVPEYFGKYRYEDKDYILMTMLNGNDLSLFDSKKAVEAARAIAKIHNDFQTEDRSHYRYECYMKIIERRSKSLVNEPVLSKAYALFMERQKDIPLTFCHGDYLPMNTLWNDEKVSIIDWGFSGYMPYALDVARMIAHGVEIPDENTFPFTMMESDKEVFLDKYYELTNIDVSKEEYRRDVKLAMLNEYVEFIESALLEEPEEVNNDIYYKFAMETAQEILK